MFGDLSSEGHLTDLLYPVSFALGIGLCESRARALLQYVEEVELNREGGSVPQTYS